MFRNIKKRIGVLVYPFLILCLPYSAQSQTQDFDAIYKTTLNLDFKKSSLLLKQSPEIEIPFGELYIANLNDVLELIFSESEERYDQLKQNENYRLNILNESANDSPYKNFVKGEIKLQWAFVKLKFGHTLSGVWGLRNAYKTVQSNIEKYPDFKLNYKTMGLLHVIFGAVPDGQKWVLNLLGLEGNVKLGVEEISKLENTKTPFDQEIRLIHAMIQSYLLEEHKSALAQLQHSSNTSKTLAEIYITALVMMKSHDAMSAIHILSQAVNQHHEQTSQLPLFQYLLGESLFQGGKYDQASFYYSSFLKNFKGASYIKDVWMKKALCSYYLGNRVLFEKDWETAKSVNSTDTEADKNANKILSARELPNFNLLNIRYAIDGGYYQRADSLILQIDPNKLMPYEHFELEYRKARLAHLSDNRSKALEHYYNVITSSEKLPETYFVPNSYLQIGYIKMEENKIDQARMYFNRVLEFKKHPYKNSLDSKAKIALATINASGD